MKLNSLIFQDDMSKMNFTLEDARKGAGDVGLQRKIRQIRKTMDKPDRNLFKQE